MFTLSRPRLESVTAIILLFSSPFVVISQEFQPISHEISQDAQVFSSLIRCKLPSKATDLPRPMITISPGDSVTVSTFPPDLVSVTSSTGDTLRLIWNQTSNIGGETNSDGTGIRITFPPDQLNTVNAGAYALVQILNGFVSLEYLSVSSGSSLTADLTSLPSDRPIVGASISSAGSAVMKASIEDLSVSSAANLTLEGDVENLSVSSASRLWMKGDIITSASFSSNANAVLDGDMNGTFSVSSHSNLTAFGDLNAISSVSSDSTLVTYGNILETVTASSSSTVIVSSESDCAFVVLSSGSKCVVMSDVTSIIEVNITADVEKLDSIFIGTDGVCTGENIFLHKIDEFFNLIIRIVMSIFLVFMNLFN